MQITIRKEQISDYPAVKDMYFQAFAEVFGPVDFVSEVVLMDVYRSAPTFNPELSLVAEADGQVAGHILIFPHPIMLGGEQVDCASLAIVGVRPELQKHGIGGRLIEAGLNIAREKGYKFSVVLGHETYYPRFGYQTKMWGTCGVKIPRDKLGGSGSLEVVPVRAKHVAKLQGMWQTWHGSIDLAIVPGPSIGDWSTYAKHVKAQVLLRQGEVVGYLRYSNPLEPGCVLARSKEDAGDVLVWLAQQAGEGDHIFVPVHPESRAGGWLMGEPVYEAWDAGMAMCLDPEFQVGKDYLEEVAAGSRTIGLMLWPALLTSAE